MLAATLDDLKVLDLSQGLAGPICAKILADFGADVIKVEPPAGDTARRMAPHAGNEAHPEKSLIYLLANLNKRGIRLDLEKPEGRELLRRLAHASDVIVESFVPGFLASIGLDYATLAQENPRLVMVSITPFGQTGPYRHFQSEEIVTYALSGIMSISGTSDREPLKHGGMQSQYEGGLCGSVGALAAIYARDFCGEGQQVDISLQDVIASTLIVHQPMYSWTGAVQGRRRPGGAQYGHVQRCKDGYFIWQTGGGDPSTGGRRPPRASTIDRALRHPRPPVLESGLDKVRGGPEGHNLGGHERPSGVRDRDRAHVRELQRVDPSAEPRT